MIVMRIAFKFHYIHDNGLFTRLLNRMVELSSLPLSLYKEGQYYRIEASGDQDDLEALAEQVSALVPQSLFLGDYSMEEIPEQEDIADVSTSLAEQNRPFKIPYCPECQKSVVKTLNPFVPCHVCGFSDTLLSIDELAVFTSLTADTEEQFFMQLADILIEKGEVNLPTYNGVRRFSLLGSHGHRDEGILFCDPTHISDKFLITQGELDALLMIEKPIVRLKAKLMFRTEHELDEPFYPLFFADDKVTLAFSTALKNKGIDAVFCDHIPTLRVASALDQHVIVRIGRDMLPWRDNLALKSAAFCEYGGVQAYGDRSGLQLDTEIELNNEPFIQYISNQNQSKVANAIRFEPSHAALRSVVIEQSLEGKALCGVYLSRENPTQIFGFSERIGYLPMVEFNDEVLLQPKKMLDAISQMDEGGMRLVSNFKKTFPELYTKVEQLHFNRDTDTSAITKLWAMAAVFIGLYEGNDILKACEILESTAIEFGGKSGPRIDYKIMSTEEGYQLDMRLAIRSAMSFKLAGLDEYLLSFGFIDSLADFIAQQAEDADANIDIDAVVLSGSLFENRQLLMRTYNALSANYPIYRNERLSIDGANVAIGAITLGNE